ncbi:hypothetical protein D1872_255050 [compost metagenome]
MLLRIKRTYVDRNVSDSVTAGRMIDVGPSIPLVGRSPRCTEKYHISSKPIQKLGMAASTNTMPLRKRSCHRFSNTLHNMPIDMLKMTMIASVAAASCKVGGIACRNSSNTGLLLT